MQKEVPKQTLKQKRFHDHYCTESHTGIEDWVITLIDRADTFKELRKGKSMKRFEKKFLYHTCIKQ